MGAYYIVYLKAKSDVSKEVVREKMDLALDWYKIDQTTWVLYSTSDAGKLYSRLSPLVKGGGNVFICKLKKSQRQGWMPKSFWKWLKKDR